MLTFTETVYCINITKDDAKNIRYELNELFLLIGEDNWLGSLENLCYEVIDVVQKDYDTHVIRLPYNEAKELMDDIMSIDYEKRGEYLTRIYCFIHNELNF